jgi:hypothetical protein
MKLNRFALIVPATAGLFLVLGSQSFGESMGEEGQEQIISLSDVPQPALSAAQQALATTPTKADIVVGTDPQVYELQATSPSDNVISVVDVFGDGTVLRKEQEPKEH